MTIWFGSDFHFNHSNVIKFCNRPFNTVHEMNEFFFSEFDSKIKYGDEVYFLGDIVFYKEQEILERLNGKERNITLVAGNHDHSKTKKDKYWKEVVDYKELKINHNNIVLFHYPIESWNRKSYNSFHFHGHTHGGLSRENKEVPNRIDVGYDSTGRVLSSLEELLTDINTKNISNLLRSIN